MEQGSNSGGGEVRVPVCVNGGEERFDFCYRVLQKEWKKESQWKRNNERGEEKVNKLVKNKCYKQRGILGILQVLASYTTLIAIYTTQIFEIPKMPFVIYKYIFTT